ncbi:MAG: dienelactone hydrolase family protein [Variovorax sp.]|nr:MAG: dienelactone hydrolase family protein [Variovorax sp.]
MMEKDVLIPTKYGSMPAFAAWPTAPGPYPAVILYMDAPGFREELRNMARRMAKHGYYCLLPDLYYRLGTLRFDVSRRTEAMSEVIRGAMHSLSNAAVVDDTGGMIAFLDAQEQVSPGPIGCVGHCMSGPFVTTIAARFGRVRAAAALYGVDMVTDKPDSPHLLAAQIRGELYAGFAEVDPSVPAHVVPDLKAALEKAGVRHEVEVVEGTHHGYCFAARPDYNPIASEATWDKLMDLFTRNLKGGA